MIASKIIPSPSDYTKAWLWFAGANRQSADSAYESSGPPGGVQRQTRRRSRVPGYQRSVFLPPGAGGGGGDSDGTGLSAGLSGLPAGFSLGFSPPFLGLPVLPFLCCLVSSDENGVGSATGTAGGLGGSNAGTRSGCAAGAGGIGSGSGEGAEAAGSADPAG